MEKDLSSLQETERKALCLDRLAISRLVSAVRRYRSACENLKRKKLPDGLVDTVGFFEQIDEIEQES